MSWVLLLAFAARVDSTQEEAILCKKGIINVAHSMSATRITDKSAKCFSITNSRFISLYPVEPGTKGGAISLNVQGGKWTMTNCAFITCSTSGQESGGGAVWCSQVRITAWGNLCFTGCATAGYGGGIGVGSGNSFRPAMTTASFSSCSSGFRGGGMYWAVPATNPIRQLFEVRRKYGFNSNRCRRWILLSRRGRRLRFFRSPKPDHF
jgi:hypothetical protein